MYTHTYVQVKGWESEFDTYSYSHFESLTLIVTNTYSYMYTHTYAQVKGWESEFDQLQSFTGMESKFTPGEKHLVDEITSRFLEKVISQISQSVTRTSRLRKYEY